MKETQPLPASGSTGRAQRTIQAGLYARLEQAPERRTIGFIDSQGGISWLTLEQFCNRASGYAARLADYGLRKGDVCILVLPSDPFCATALLATLLAGAVPLLVAPQIVQGLNTNLIQNLRRLIRKTRARVVIGSDSLAVEEQMLTRAHPTTRFIFGEGQLAGSTSKFNSFAKPSESDIAALQLTSGTTGSPRICVWKQQNVMVGMDAMAAAMRLSVEDVCLNWTPLYHDMGLVNNFLACLTKGITLVMLNPLDFIKKPSLWLRGLSETGATITWSPNFGFAFSARRITNQEMEGIRLDRVRAFFNAAERIHLETIQAFYDKFSPFGVRWEAFKTCYGSAENICGATFSDPEGRFLVEHLDRSVLREKGVAQPVAKGQDNSEAIAVVGVGRPYPGMQIQILSRSGRPLPDGHVGEMALKTPSRLDGYLGDAQATRRAICGDLLRTGDLAYLRGQEVFWVGRSRERIALRGTKLDPSEFELVLAGIPDLRTGCYVVFGVDDPKEGTQRIVVATEVLDTTARSPQEIIGAIREQVLLRVGVMVNEVILVERGTLAKTSSGKRRHRHFRFLYKSGALRASIMHSNNTALPEKLFS